MPKKNAFDQPGSLMAETIRMAKDQDLFELYSETKVPFYWLRKFVNGSFANPSVNRVQYLYEHLTKKQLLS